MPCYTWIISCSARVIGRRTLIATLIRLNVRSFSLDCLPKWHGLVPIGSLLHAWRESVRLRRHSRPQQPLLWPRSLPPPTDPSTNVKMLVHLLNTFFVQNWICMYAEILFIGPIQCLVPSHFDPLRVISGARDTVSVGVALWILFNWLLPTCRDRFFNNKKR